MSKKYKSQASSARAAASLSGAFGFSSSFQTNSSLLAYVTELPDLSQISEPNVVVAFKNLGKKDSTTKAKALDDLHDYCTSVDSVEQPILAAWCEIYPRTSIDNSRRVRQLAHDLQGLLTSSSGKRIARLLPKVVGPWLAGTFDSDRIVARSAQDALQRSFPSPDKIQALWETYRDALFDHVEDAVTVQTRQTLSDERTTSPDDAEAKYVRVVGTAVGVLTALTKNHLTSEATKNLLGERRVWELVCSSDPYLRRSSSNLAVAACESRPDYLDWSLISTCFLSKGLQSSQVGSSLQFSDALIALTMSRPGMWTTDYTSKTSVIKRLQQFLRQGSQGGSEKVWSNFSALLRIVPEEVWVTNDATAGIIALAESIRQGINQPSERVNVFWAWVSYIEICLGFMDRLDEEDGKQLIAEGQLVPVIIQYITKKEDHQWSVGGRPQELISAIVTGVLKRGVLSPFERTWSRIIESTIETMRLSLPESSKDFRTSQDAIAAQSQRLFQVFEAIIQSKANNDSLLPILESCNVRLIQAAVDLLRTRNGKPYGAAAVVKNAVQTTNFDKTSDTLQRFFDHDLSNLLDSPSAGLLASAAYDYGSTSVIDLLLQNQSTSSEEALCSLLRHIRPERLTSDMQQNIERLLTSGEQSTSLQIASAIMSNVELIDLHQALMERVQSLLSPVASQQSRSNALDLVEVCLSSSNRVLNIPVKSRALVMSNILALAESDTELAGRAEQLVYRINERARSDPVHDSSSETIIQQQLNGEGSMLSVLTLLDLAKTFIEKDFGKIDLIFPSSEQWKTALKPHIEAPRPYSLAITSPLQGLLYTLQTHPSTTNQPGHDADGFSQAFRLILYSSKLAQLPNVLAKLGEPSLHAMQKSFPVAVQLVNEKLTVDNANDLWLYSAPEVLEDAANILSQGSTFIQMWLDQDAFVTYWISKARSFEQQRTSTYSWALAWTSVVSSIVDIKGPSQVLQEYEEVLKTAHRSQALTKSCVLVSVLREHLPLSTSGKRLTNELVAGATAPTAELKHLILLNILADGATEPFETVPPQRLVFMLKNVLNVWDQREEPGFLSECMKIVGAILPLVADIYGEHWEQIFNKLIRVWAGDVDLPLLYASIRMLARLRMLLSSKDANEDLVSAWESAKFKLDAGLLNNLHNFGKMTLEVDQPRDITADLLRRQLVKVDLAGDLEVFELLASPVESIQTAAYAILHRSVPKRQEELSLDLVLDGSLAHIPETLLHQLKDVSRPRQHLLVWNIIFDHFSSASFKLREAYVADIKKSGHIGHLLDFVCEAIRVADSRPVDASKFTIDGFEIEEAGPADKELTWLAVHAYYNCLLHLPSLTKEWFLNQKNRIKIPLEAWTTKYISPAIITASLTTVRHWATSQSADDDKVLEVKSSSRSSELIASIEIDPENPPISIVVSLPGSYPLESPVVISRTRVGVSEKNWQSWLKTFQIIIFSSGSIIEGLIAFRRNVQGALKGQTECAICYSIIGTDMQTPSKKCGTCKNMFHGACLFRWFKSSNSSSCPLCRNNFNYA